MTTIAKRTFAVALSLILVGALSLPVFGVSDAYAETSAEKQAEADAISANIDSLQTQINDKQAEVDDATQRQDDAQAAAEDARGRVVAANERISELQDQLGVRAVDMYKSGGSAPFIDVLLGATSFESFLTSWDAVNAIAGQDASLVQETKQVRTEAENAQVEFETQRATAANEREAAEAAQAELEAAQAAMQEELEKVNEEVAVLQAQEEAERIAAEEAAARAAAAKAAANSVSINTGGGFTPPPISGPAPTISVSGWAHPCPGYYGVTNEFGWDGAWDGSYHNGIDLGAAAGTPIYAAGSGTVTYVGWYGSGGNAVIITHGGGIRTIYMHQSAFACSQGQSVSAGDLIGYVGSTGYSTGPHLHFQIEVGGTPVNPRNYYSF